MSKLCIFDSKVNCNNCGECEKCDLDKNKICNNCGKCMDIDGYESKSVFIEKIIEDAEEIKKYENQGDSLGKDQDGAIYHEDENFFNDYDENYSRNEKDDIPLELELIDDIDGLNEILEDEDRRANITEEKFPGFFVLKSNKS